MEHEIIRSDLMKRPPLLTLHTILTIIFSAGFIACRFLYNYLYEKSRNIPGVLVDSSARAQSDSLKDTAILFSQIGMGVGFLAAFFALILIIWLIVYSTRKHSQIVVTDKRVYGTAVGNKQVDLPLDSISAVGIKGKGFITVSTSSGSISFYLTNKRNEIKEAITRLIVARQNLKQRAPIVQSTPVATSDADEIKKYKNLLDMGAISQEEFDAKKKQILGL